MTDYKDKLNGFAQRMKTETPITGTIQEIRPVAEKAKIVEPETQLNIWIPKTLMKKLKRHSLDTEKTLKDTVIEAIIKYLN